MHAVLSTPLWSILAAAIVALVYTVALVRTQKDIPNVQKRTRYKHKRTRY